MLCCRLWHAHGRLCSSVGRGRPARRDACVESVVSFGGRIHVAEHGGPMFKRRAPLGTTRNDVPKQARGLRTGPQPERPSALLSVIPADLTVTGDLVSTGEIHVEGVIQGNINCRTLTLAGEPVIKGSVEAQMVRVCGTFEGQIRAKEVVLTEAARMIGEINYESLEIEPGASFEGTLSRVEAA